MTEEELPEQDAPPAQDPTKQTDADFFKGVDSIPATPGKANDAEFFKGVQEVDAATDPAINYAIKTGTKIDGERAKRILNVRHRLSENTPVPFIDRNLDYLEQKTSEKDFEQNLFYNHDTKLKDWVTENAPRAALLRSNPEEMQKLGLMKLLIERPPALWPASEATITSEARTVAKLRAEEDWKNYTAGAKERIAGVAAGGGFGAPYTGPEVFSSQKQMEDAYYQAELSDRRGEEDYIRGSGEAGPLDTLGKMTRENPMFYLPFMRSVPDLANKFQMLMAKKADQAGDATDVEKDLIRRTARVEAVANLRGKSVLGHAVEQGTTFPAMALEMMTGTKIGSAAVKGLMGEELKGFSKTLGSWMLESAVSGATAGAPNAAETYMSRATPEGALGEDEQGRIVYKYSGEKGEPQYMAIPKAALSSFADYFGAKVFGPWFANASPEAKALAKQSLVMAFPKEAAKFVGMTELSEFIKGAGGVHSLEAPSIVKAFKDPETAKKVGVQLLMGGVMGTVHAAAHNTRAEVFDGKLKEIHAEMVAEGIDQLTDLAKDSKVMTETPNEGQDFVKRFSEDGPHSHVYIGTKVWNKYWESKGISPREMAKTITGDTANYDEASKVENGHLQIPMADYITKLTLSEEHGKAFNKDVKLDPEMSSVNELKADSKSRGTRQPLAPEEFLNSAAGQPYSDLWFLGAKGDKAAGYKERLDAAMGEGLEQAKNEEIAKRQRAQDKELNALREQVRPQVEAMVNDRPEQKALEHLQGKAELPEGVQGMKLDKGAVRAKYGDKVTDVLPRGIFAPQGKPEKSTAIHPEYEPFAKELKGIINGVTDPRMTAKLGGSESPLQSLINQAHMYFYAGHDTKYIHEHWGTQNLGQHNLLPSEFVKDPSFKAEYMRVKESLRDLWARLDEAKNKVDKITNVIKLPDLLEPKPSAEKRASSGTGVDPDTAAEALGFSSGDELMAALSENAGKSKADTIKEEMHKLLMEERPDLFDTPKLSDSDIENIKGDQHSRLLKMQWDNIVSNDYATAKGLIKGVERKPRSQESYRVQAVTEIGNKSVRDTNPAQYKADMEASRKAAEEAILNGDTPAAADAKEQELISYERYKAALETQRRNKALLNWAKRTQTKEFEASLGKAGKGYLQAFYGIADRFDLAKVPEGKLESRQALRDFINEKQADGGSLGEEVSSPEWLLKEAGKQNYKDLTNDQFRDIVELVQQLDTMARKENQLIAGEKAAAWEESEAKLEAEIRQNKPLGIEPTRSAEGFLDKLKIMGRKVNASLIKTEQFLKEMTGGKIDAEWMNRFWHPLADAQAREYDYQEKITGKIAEAVKDMPPEIQARMREKVALPGARLMTRMDLIGLALNAGNDSNLSKLVRGEMQRKGGLTERQIHDALNMLTAPEIEYVNKIHRILESIKPDLQALHQELTGLPMEEVTPRSMQLENGKIEGGYYPLIYDASQSTQGAKQQEAKVGDMQTDGYSRATLGWGHRKGRVEGFSAPIDFDVENLPSHIAGVIKDITHRKWMIDANKIMQSKSIRAALTETYGEEMTNRLTEVVKEAVNDRNQPSLKSLSVWRRAITGFRTNTAIVATGFKIATLMEHTFSIGAAVDHLGAEYFQKGMGEVIQAPKEALKTASDKSGEVRHFLENGSRDIRDKLRDLQGKGGFVADAQRTAAYAIGYANMVRALPVWWGGYHKAMAELSAKGMTGAELEKYAVRSADQALRLTVGTAGAKDLTAIQSGARGGDLMKMFTMFYTPGAILYSRLHDIGHEAANTKDIPRALVRAFWVVPFAATMQALVRGDFPDKEKGETWGGWWLKNNATYPFSSTPILRDIANTAIMGHESSVDTPGTAAIKNILQAADFSKRAFEGEATAKDALEKAYKAGNYFMGLPTDQLQTIGDYLYDMEKGEAQSNGVFELYKNLLHYRHKYPK